MTTTGTCQAGSARPGSADWTSYPHRGGICGRPYAPASRIAPESGLRAASGATTTGSVVVAAVLAGHPVADLAAAVPQVVGAVLDVELIGQAIFGWNGAGGVELAARSVLQPGLRLADVGVEAALVGVLPAIALPEERLGLDLLDVAGAVDPVGHHHLVGALVLAGEAVTPTSVMTVSSGATKAGPARPKKRLKLAHVSPWPRDLSGPIPGPTRGQSEPAGLAGRGGRRSPASGLVRRAHRE